MEAKSKKNFKIVFMMPPQEKQGDFRDLRDFILDNQGVKSLMHSLEAANYKSQFINSDLLDLSMEQLVSILEYMGEPDLLGISMVENNVEMVVKFLDVLKERNYKTKIVAGGFFPSLCYEELMENCPYLDYCITGEGEKAIVELVQCLEGKKTVTHIPGLVYRDERNQIIANSQIELNVSQMTMNYNTNMPYLIERGGAEYIFTSRGCNGNCKFCSIKAFYQYIPKRPWREICISNIVDRVEDLNKNWHQQIIPLWDDNFLSGKRGKERAYEFISEIKKRNINAKYFINCRVDDVDEELFSELKAIGLYQVGLGIENVSQEVLKFYGKGTNTDRVKRALDILDRLGLETYTSYIIYNPFSTMEQVEINLDFIQKRAEVEKGSTFKNMLQPSVTVLALTRGARILNDEKVKEVSFKKGYHYEYEMQDKKVEKLKKLMLYLSAQWWRVYIALINLDNFVFRPYFSYFKKMEDKEAVDEYQNLWKSLATVHLDTYRKLMEKIKKDDEDMDDILELYINEVNRITMRTKNLIERYNLDSVFPKIQYFTFEKEGQIILFDITKSEFFEIGEIHKVILENYNFRKRDEIRELLKEKYEQEEINRAFQYIDDLIKNGNMECKMVELIENNVRKFIRTCHFIVKGRL